MAPLVNGGSKLALGRLMEEGFVQRRLLGICCGVMLGGALLLALRVFQGVPVT